MVIAFHEHIMRSSRLPLGRFKMVFPNTEEEKNIKKKNLKA